VPVEIDDMIRAGETVVVNVSRAVLGTARARYARTCVLLVDADPALRARRIASRGRECAEALAERLAREATVRAPSRPTSSSATTAPSKRPRTASPTPSSA
jgi:ribose 1,5-bisphosphokinase